MSDISDQSMKENTDALANMSNRLDQLIDIQTRLAQKQGIDIKSINEQATAFGKSVGGAAGATKSLQAANEEYEKRIGSLKQSAASAATGFDALAKTILDSNRSFSKYSGAIDKLPLNKLIIQQKHMMN